MNRVQAWNYTGIEVTNLTFDNSVISSNLHFLAPLLISLFSNQIQFLFSFFLIISNKKKLRSGILVYNGKQYVQREKNLIIGITGLCSAEFMLCHKLRHILGFLDCKSYHLEIFFFHFSPLYLILTHLEFKKLIYSYFKMFTRNDLFG